MPKEPDGQVARAAPGTDVRTQELSPVADGVGLRDVPVPEVATVVDGPRAPAPSLETAPTVAVGAGNHRVLGSPDGRIGTSIADRWVLESMLGYGGMGVVYSATHRNGSSVAIKVLRSEFVRSRSVVRRFRREGYLANKIPHPAVVVAIDDGILDDGCPYIVMPLLDGESFATKLSREGPLPARAVAQYMTVLLEVLESAHRVGILHLDLKPANLFLTRSGELKVLDFGIAKVLDAALDDARVSAETTVGAIMGTTGYMAPEQARGERQSLSAQADLWAVGATALALSACARVHRAESENEALLLAATAPAPLCVERFPALPRPLAQWIDRALAFEIHDRFPDARSMRHALGTFASTLPEHVDGSMSRSLIPPSRAPTSVWQAIRARWRLGMVAAVTSALVTFLWFAFGRPIETRSRETGRERPGAARADSAPDPQRPIQLPAFDAGAGSVYTDAIPYPQATTSAPATESSRGR